MKKDPKKSLTFLSSHSSLLTLKYNNSFCNQFFEKSKISTILDEPDYFNESSHLVYDFSKVSYSNSEVFGTIIDLLLQLRAAQSDQNIFVQNNTVVREQILSQLKNEILKVNHKLTSNQIKNLEVLSSDSFNEENLTDLLNSFLKSSKKKSEKRSFLKPSYYALPATHKLTLKNDLSSYYKSIYDVEYNKKIFNKSIEKIHNKRSVKNLNLSEPSLKEKNHDSNLKESNEEEFFRKFSEKKLFKKSKKKTIASYELKKENLLKKYSLVLPVIKSQIKFSETEILNKTKLFVQDIINKNVVNLIPSETEIVNKVLAKTQINDLRENFLRNYERYEYYHFKNQTEIRKVQSELKKIQSFKSTSYNKNYILKSSGFIESYTKNLLKKNIVKFVSGNEVINKFEDISENYFNDYIRKKAIYRHDLINKTFESKNIESIRKDIYNKTNLKHKALNFEEKSFKDAIEDDILINDINRKRLEYKNVYKNFHNISKENLIISNLKKSRLDFISAQLNNLVNLNSENKIVNLKKFNYENRKIFNNSIKNNAYELLNFLNIKNINKKNSEVLNKAVDLISLNEENQLIKNVKQKKEVAWLNLFKEYTNKNIYLNQVDLLKKIISSKINLNLHKNKIIENLKGINKVKDSFNLIKSYKNFSYDINSIKSFKRFSVLNSGLKLIYKGKSSDDYGAFQDFYADGSYLIYKQSENKKQENIKPEVKKEKKQKSKSENLIQEKSKPIAPQAINMSLIEKQILAKTLGKKEIVDLIESYIREINLDSISRMVMNKLENRISLERKRNGIF